ncbi:MAG: hypothetical protein Q7U14_08740, partial [Lacisediminimonas sp.]|nr:hypothetical protein [Lacisediminimonas sp.]
ARSVKAADMPHAVAAGGAGRAAATATVLPATARLAISASARASPAPDTLHAAANARHDMGEPAGRASQAQGLAAPGPGAWPAALRAQATACTSSDANSARPRQAMQTVALPESHYRRQWPLKNVHLECTAHGVRLWIRDPDLAAGAQGELLARHLATTLKADGRQLLGLTINCNRIL